MNHYNVQIMGFTGCSEDDAGIIQGIMRNIIFHSTLDWQTTAELRHAALEAQRALETDRSPWEEWRDSCRRTFEEGERATREAVDRTAAVHQQSVYEI